MIYRKYMWEPIEQTKDNTSETKVPYGNSRQRNILSIWKHIGIA